MPKSNLEVISGTRGHPRTAVSRQLRATALALGLLIAGIPIGQPALADDALTEVQSMLDTRLARARDALAAEGQALPSTS